MDFETLLRYTNYTAEALRNRKSLFPKFILDQIVDLENKRDNYLRLKKDKPASEQQELQQNTLAETEALLTKSFSRIKSLQNSEQLENYFPTTPTESEGDYEKTLKLIENIVENIKKDENEDLLDLKDSFEKNLNDLKSFKLFDKDQLQDSFTDWNIAYKKLKGYVESYMLDHRTDYRVFFLELYHTEGWKKRFLTEKSNFSPAK